MPRDLVTQLHMVPPLLRHFLSGHADVIVPADEEGQGADRRGGGGRRELRVHRVLPVATDERVRTQALAADVLYVAA